MKRVRRERSAVEAELLPVASAADRGVATVELLGMLPIVLACVLAIVQATGLVNASLRAEQHARSAALSGVGRPGAPAPAGVRTGGPAAPATDVVLRRVGDRVEVAVRVPLVLPLSGKRAVTVTADARLREPYR